MMKRISNDFLFYDYIFSKSFIEQQKKKKEKKASEWKSLQLT